jgi:hypothetical protein
MTDDQPQNRNHPCESVYNILYERVKCLDEDVRRRVPIWVFTLVIVIFLAIMGYWANVQNRSLANTSRALVLHVETSNVVLKSLSLGLREIAANQQIVMNQLELEYKELRDYERGLME